MLHLIALLGGCTTEGPPRLALPIDCEVGADCWITSRPDRDPGPGIRDHLDGSHTYDRHSGTDLDVAHTGAAAATWVLAPVAGTVLGARDGVPDGELLAGGPATTADQECGNGARIDAGGGWTVQLCHLARGTIQVRSGERLTAGARLGRVGLSGETNHPHVHLTVRRDDRLVDPFDGTYVDDGSPAAPGPLWAAMPPPPVEMDALAWGGFVAGPASAADPWPVDGPRVRIPRSAPSLLVRAFVWRPMAGDVVRIEIRRPDGTMTSSEAVQPEDRPRYTWTVEKTWTEAERPVGLWTARIEWRRGTRTRTRWASAVVE